jgi:hypothetical protein
MEFIVEGREKRKRKGRGGRSEATLQNTTYATSHGRGHRVASKVVAEASVLPPDGGSRLSKSAKPFHTLVAFLNIFKKWKKTESPLTQLNNNKKNL